MTWNLIRKLRPARKPPLGFRFRPGVEWLETRELLAASPIIFSVLPASSSLTLSGSFGTNNLMQQGAGSLTTTYGGSIATAWDPAVNTLSFSASHNIVANNSGNWQPSVGGEDATTAPANYGGRINGTVMGQSVILRMAIRGLTAAASTTSPLTLTGGGTLFNFPSTQTLTLTGGVGDYRATDPLFDLIRLDFGVVQLAGETGLNMAPTQGTFEDQGNGAYRLTAPIRFTYTDVVEGQTLTLIVNGTVVGTAILPVVDLNGPASGADFSATAVGGGPAVLLADPAATVTRTPTANLTQAVVTLTNRPDGAAEMLDADVTGTSLTKAYDPATGRLTLSGSAASSVYEQVLRTVTYRNTLIGANTANRIVEFTASDGTNSSLIRTTTVTVQAPLVATVTMTPTGFRANFNRPFNPVPLNLYDTNIQTGGVLGPADATLTHSVNGPVTGSLIIEPGNTAVTFVATSGVLAEGSYTVMLRSAANGFTDTSGGLLDGNADGMTGDAFSNPFTVASSSSRIVSLPNLARGPGQVVDLPVGTNGIPITLSDGMDVTSISLDLRYNHFQLSLGSFTRSPAVPMDATVTFNPSVQPGVARLQITSTTPLSTTPGAIELGRIAALIPDNAGYTHKYVLNLDNISIMTTGGAVAARDDDAVAVVTYLGDASGNGFYSAQDATLLLRNAVALDGGMANLQLLDPLIVGDVAVNGLITATDSTRILQESVGLAQPAQIPRLPATPPMIMVTGPDPFLNIPKTFVAGRHGVVAVPVNLDRSDGLESLDLAITYDARRLELISTGDVQRGDLTADFDLFLVNHNARTGELRVALGRTAGALEGQGSGSVLMIFFRVRGNAPTGRAIINLRENIGHSFTGLNEGGLDLIPDPSNKAGDVLDGQILVVRRLPGAPVMDRFNHLNMLAAILNGRSTKAAPTLNAAPANGPSVTNQVQQFFGNNTISNRTVEAIATVLHGKADEATLNLLPRSFLNDLLSPNDPLLGPPVGQQGNGVLNSLPPNGEPGALANGVVQNTPVANTPGSPKS